MWRTSGIQNGGPDGVALSYAGGAGSVLVEFVCYEGTMTAASGPAAGATCRPMNVEESNDTPEGTSLQRVGTGADGRRMGWVAGAAASPGAANAGQTVETPRHVASLDGPGGWRLLAAPAATTVANLLGSLWTQGAVGSSAPDGPATVYAWEVGTGWAAVADLDRALAPGQGLSVYVFDDDDPTAPGVQGGFPKEIGASGYAAGAPFRFGLRPGSGGAEGGFTLVGNPDGAGLAWGDHWDPRRRVVGGLRLRPGAPPATASTTGRRGPWTAAWSPAFTAFWVEATGPAPRLVAPSVVAARLAPRAVETLQLVARAEIGGQARTALATVALDSQARSDRDALDGLALDPLAPDHVRLATVAGADRMGLDARPLAPGDTVLIDVGVVEAGAAVGGEVVLSWPEVPASLGLGLLDRATGHETPLSPGGSRTVSVSPDAPRQFAVVAHGRSVAMAPAVARGEMSVRLGPSPTPGPSWLWAEAPGAALSAEVFDALGRRVGRLAARPGALDAALPTDGLAPGVYVVRVRATHADGQETRRSRRLVVTR